MAVAAVTTAATASTAIWAEDRSCDVVIMMTTAMSMAAGVVIVAFKARCSGFLGRDASSRGRKVRRHQLDRADAVAHWAQHHGLRADQAVR